MSESYFVAPQRHKDFETKRYFLQCRSRHAINLLFKLTLNALTA